MRRKPILSFLLAASILGGMVLLFPHLWMVLIIALLVLITVQMILVRRNLFTLPPGRTEMAMPASPPESGATETTETATAAQAAAPSIQPEEKPGSFESAFESADAAQAVPDGAPQGEEPGASPAAEEKSHAESKAASSQEEDAVSPAIDSSVFSRFREHLERVESEGPARSRSPRRKSAPSGTARSISGEDGELEMVVDISSAARRPPGRGGATMKGDQPTPPSKPVQPAAPVAEEDPGPDLFADLRPEPPTKAPAERQDAGPAAADAPTESQAPPRDVAGQEGGGHAAPPAAKEITEDGSEGADAEGSAGPGAAPPGSSAPEAPSDSPDTTTLASEAASLLKLAGDAAAREDWEEARAGLQNYLAHLSGHPELVDWRAHRLEARMAVLAGDANRALQGFEAMLEAGYQPVVEGVPTLLEELLAGTEEAIANSLRVSMLVRILAVFRQSRDQGAMDRAYGWIEMAQEKVGDEKKLIQYLKNHLEIRRSMGNVAGQLELIDQLGNRCYKLGLTEEAKVYYEMGLKLKGEKGEGGDAEKEGGETADESR